ncbi:MAG: hypothetical protein N3E45_11310 [Oscillatoriaceae bacterium SKW80]|nr:hypothetical protein [Oscillatoriaceae bacterium SKYG93]MCX8121393.1 hypothetical protein [Oscillatoriaceae bacterium SKW80]MDW8451930.1 hypothetical protein [Oscillatoriaceae cyanobacterium SKYGB_i_bin93]HIK29473.1 hypothetical protein [Oscillatoriaceae cyanobacterium M7585_C2015_266]
MQVINSVESPAAKSLIYPPHTIKRAERAIRCAPFSKKLYTTMLTQSVSIGSITGESGVQLGYTRSPKSELAADSALSWLIQVGLLRREVDGQGLTDSFRLTPLGRQLVEKWQAQEENWLTPTFKDRFLNALSRWLRLPL